MKTGRGMFDREGARPFGYHHVACHVGAFRETPLPDATLDGKGGLQTRPYVPSP